MSHMLWTHMIVRMHIYVFVCFTKRAIETCRIVGLWLHVNIVDVRDNTFTLTARCRHLVTVIYIIHNTNIATHLNCASVCLFLPSLKEV